MSQAVHYGAPSFRTKWKWVLQILLRQTETPLHIIGDCLLFQEGRKLLSDRIKPMQLSENVV